MKTFLPNNLLSFLLYHAEDSWVRLRRPTHKTSSVSLHSELCIIEGNKKNKTKNKQTLTHCSTSLKSTS